MQAFTMSIETALYGLFTVLMYSFVIDAVSPIGRKKMQVKIISAKYPEVRDMLINGDGAHWIITSDGVLNNLYSNYGDDVNKRGAFGVPGDHANNHGITTWPEHSTAECQRPK